MFKTLHYNKVYVHYAQGYSGTTIITRHSEEEKIYLYIQYTVQFIK